MVAERSRLAGRPPGEDVRVESQKERALIDEVVSRIAHQADAVEQPSADKLSGDNDGIQSERQMQTRAQVFIGSQAGHTYSVARARRCIKR